MPFLDHVPVRGAYNKIQDKLLEQDKPANYNEAV